MYRPSGVSSLFKVTLDEIKPAMDKRFRRLLAKQLWRAPLSDEMAPCRPEVSWISKPKSLACLGVRLARTGTGPNRSIIWPSGAAKGERPDTDSCEEVALCVVLEVIWVNILDRSIVRRRRQVLCGLRRSGFEGTERHMCRFRCSRRLAWRFLRRPASDAVALPDALAGCAAVDGGVHNGSPCN